MTGPFTHNIDPVITSVFGVHLWWYGLSYSLGFLNAHLFLRRNRQLLGLSLTAVYDLTLFLAVGVMIGGRCLVVFVNEWQFYSEHLHLIPAIWIGGLATHGVIVGGFTGVLVFCVAHGKPIRPMLDALAIPAAFILGCGRIGNFIDGQIVGSLTDVPWAVKFPEAEGFRHPVLLYDGLKNFLLVPLLLWVRTLDVPAGRVAVLFAFLYAALRIPIDLLREYPITFLELPAGQSFNIIMAAVGLALLVRNWFRAGESKNVPWREMTFPQSGLVLRRVALAVALAVPLVVPSDATRDVPTLYGKRHTGLSHSVVYPVIGP